jgi:hypothetical protein
MFHNDIMASMMQERVRDLRASANSARDGRISRRARKFWAEEAAQQVAPRRPSRRSHARRAAGATGR